MLNFRLFVISILSSVLFFLNQYAFDGYIQSKETLAKELQSTSQTLSDWELSEKPPFKYRMLFPMVVKNLSKIIPGHASENQKFYWSYLFLSWLFFIATSCMLYLVLQKILQSSSMAFLGVFLHLSMVPVLFAYTLPIHTREDQMAFLFLLSAIYFLYNRNHVFYLIIACLGVFVRETLLLLPFFVLLFAKLPLIRKLILSALPLLIWIAFRWLIGADEYDFWQGLNWNLSNPIQIIFFSFLSFSYLWPHFIFSFETNQNQEDTIGLFSYKAVVLSVLIIFLTTFLFGIFNEIRLLYLIFPWVIISSLRIIEKHQELWIEFLKNKYVLVASLLMILLVVILAPYITDLSQNAFGDNQYGVPYGIWAISFLIYFIPTVLSLIFYLFYQPKLENEKL
ncbi:hypothetical protein [Marivirga sp.]|uniref:hypothetical protein n=1 Tax=Marivirga sp. TaxID=2018662 RepID=UPI0025D3BD74|nr:hypothetical protein [Marivirga sp.]